MKKIGSRLLSLLLCIMMIVTCIPSGVLPIASAVEADVTSTVTEDAFPYFEDNFDDYAAGALPVGSYYTFNGNSVTPTVVAEEGRGNVLSLNMTNAGGNFEAFNFEIASTQLDRIVSFDFKFDASSVGSWGGMYVKPHYDGEDAKQVYATMSNGSVVPGITLKSKAGDEDIIKKQSYTFENTWYSAKIKLEGNDISVKVWKSTDSEPADWTAAGTAQYTPTNANAPVRMEFVVTDGNTENFLLDNLKVENLQLADNFDSYTADSALPAGSLYTFNGNSVTPTVVAEEGRGNVLSLNMTNAGGNFEAYNFEVAAGLLDRELSFDFKFDASSVGSWGGMYVKPHYDGEDAKQIYATMSNGSVIPGITLKSKAGDEDIIKKQSYTFENTWYSAKIRLEGNDISVKVWKSTDSEPADWTAAGTAQYTPTNANAPVRMEFVVTDGKTQNFLLDNLKISPVSAEQAGETSDYLEDITNMPGLTFPALSGAEAAAAETLLAEKDGREKVLQLTGGKAAVSIPSATVEKKVTFDFMYEGSFRDYLGMYFSLYRESDVEFDGMGGAIMPAYNPEMMVNMYAPGLISPQPNTRATVSAGTWYTCTAELSGGKMNVKVQKADGTGDVYSVTGTIPAAYTMSDSEDCSFILKLEENSDPILYLDNIKLEEIQPAAQGVVTVTVDETRGTVTGAGSYDNDSSATLTATAKEGYTFLCWKKDGAIVSQSAEYTVTVDGDATYTAVFDPDVGDPDVVHFEDDYQEYREGLVEKKYMPVQYVGFENGDFYTVEDDNGNMYIEGTATTSSPKIYIDCSIVDKEVVFDFCYDGSFAKNYHGGLYVKLLDAKATSGGKNEQYFSINPELSNGKLNISNTIDGKLTQQGTLMSFSEDTWYTVRSRMVNQRVYVKIWESNQTEPDAWTSICDMSAPVASNADARFYFELHDKGNSVKIKLDNIQINTWEKLAEKNSYTITAAVNDETMGRVVGDGQYYMNNEAALVALPNDGYGFVNWTENGTVISTNSTLTFTVTENRDVVANFEKLQPTIRSFMANGMTAPAVINAADKTITVTFASDINLAAVRPYFYLENWTDTTGVPQPYEIMDLSSGTAEIGDWTVNASQNEVMTVFYVDGSVASSGNGKTAGTAFKTISEAQAAVRAITEWTGDVLVNIADGEYLLDETLTFDSRDSAENNCAVIYRAASDNENGVVISSGHKLTGWTQSDEINGAWEISVPGMAYSRDLYVDGKKAVIARSNGLPGSLSRNDSICGYSASGDLANLYNWRNVDNIEFIYEVSWTYSIIPVASASAGEIRMMESAFKAGRNKPGVQIDVPGYIQNAFELLDQPGEWYFDEDGATIYYYPENGADPNTLDIVIPTLDQLVTVNGTGTDTVDGLAFQGLTFEYTSFIRPQEMGQVEIQANFVVDPDMVESCASMKHDCYEKTTGGVTIAYATGVRVADCTFRHFSASGLDFEEGVVGSTIVGNTFNNISASGIQIGGVSVRDAHPYYSGTYVNGVWNDAAGADPARVTESILILSNDLEKIGVDYKGSVAIFAGYVRDITIAHNRLHDLPYSGISIGWGWGYWDQGCRPDGISMGYHVFEEPTIQARYVVENNHISVTMQRLKDGGGIYSLSLMPGSIIRGNYMHDSKNFFGGIYNDEASGGFVTISDNITTSSVYDPYFYHNVGGYYPDRAAQTEAVMTNNYDQQDSGDAKYDQIKANAGLLDLSNTNVEPDLVNPDQVAAEAVDALIDAIGSVTLNSKDEIDAARAAYDALTDVQKAKVTKLSVLTAAEAKYKELAEEAEQDEIDEAAANVVEEKIDAIGTVTLKSKDAIEAARRAYDALTDAQKALVGNYDELVAAEAELEDLIEDAFLNGSLIISGASNPFKDIKNHWAKDAIGYVYAKGLMNGVSDNKFDPDGTLTRAMVVTILYRLDNEPVTFGTMPFSDVESGSWYAKAVLWASKNNIVNGMGDGSFAPMQNITREQFASILYRYAQYRGERTGAAANLNGYKDAGQISGWATEAMAWAAAEGLINGRTATTIAPKGTATRAEAATILERFCKLF